MASSGSLVHLFKDTFFTEHIQGLFLIVPGFTTAALLKRELQRRRFSMNFAKL